MTAALPRHSPDRRHSLVTLPADVLARIRDMSQSTVHGDGRAPIAGRMAPATAMTQALRATCRGLRERLPVPYADSTHRRLQDFWSASNRRVDVSDLLLALGRCAGEPKAESLERRLVAHAEYRARRGAPLPVCDVIDYLSGPGDRRPARERGGTLAGLRHLIRLHADGQTHCDQCTAAAHRVATTRGDARHPPGWALALAQATFVDFGGQTVPENPYFDGFSARDLERKIAAGASPDKDDLLMLVLRRRATTPHRMPLWDALSVAIDKGCSREAVEHLRVQCDPGDWPHRATSIGVHAALAGHMGTAEWVAAGVGARRADELRLRLITCALAGGAATALQWAVRAVAGRPDDVRAVFARTAAEVALKSQEWGVEAHWGLRLALVKAVAPHLAPEQVGYKIHRVVNVAPEQLLAKANADGSRGDAVKFYAGALYLLLAEGRARGAGPGFDPTRALIAAARAGYVSPVEQLLRDAELRREAGLPPGADAARALKSLPPPTVSESGAVDPHPKVVALLQSAAECRRRTPDAVAGRP